MNPRFALLAVAVIMALLVAPTSAFAQGYGVGGGTFFGHGDNPNGPTVSPYLNLLNNNNNLIGLPSYQSLVKPLVDQQTAINQQGAALQRLQQQVTAPSAPRGAGGARATGHVTYFQNLSHYYPPARRR